MSRPKEEIAKIREQYGISKHGMQRLLGDRKDGRGLEWFLGLNEDIRMIYVNMHRKGK